MHGNVLSKDMASTKTSKKKTSHSAKSKKTSRSKKASRPKAAKWVYTFGGGKAEGRADMRNLLGGKGAGLAEMANLGLPVPPGFTITTDVCTFYYDNRKSYPGELVKQVADGLAHI